jgi:hypothetical protein
LLDSELADRDVWPSLGRAAHDAVVRRELVDRALLLYRSTNPTIRAAPLDEGMRRVDHVAATLRNIADCFALESRPGGWSPEMRADAAIPTRDSILNHVRRSGVAPHLQSVTTRDEIDALPLRDSDVEFATTPAPASDVPRFAEDCASSLEAFDGIEHFASADDGLARLAEGMEDPSRLSLAATRVWGGWAYRSLPAPAVALSAIALHIQQLLFVVVQDPRGGDPLFPDGDWIRLALRSTGALGWLQQQGVDVPPWIS